MLALGSALGCVGGISCLSSQKTARLGVSVGMSGILTGLAATLAYMHPAELGTYAQVRIHVDYYYYCCYYYCYYYYYLSSYEYMSTHRPATAA